MKMYKKIISDYDDRYVFKSSSNPNTFTSYFRFGIIVVPLKCNIWDSNEAMFELLHEIGHCETFKEKQTKCFMEYLATQWAISKSKEYNITISDKEKREWQEYIYSFTTSKNKKRYQLDWSPMERG